MSAHCERQDELLDALAAAYVGPELTAHLDECVACAELRLVAGALLDERAEAIAEAAVPSAGTMWFRMQLRRRQEAQAATRRTLLLGQAATLVIALALGVTLLGSDVIVGVREVIAIVRASTPLLLVLASFALLAPIAGWVAVRSK